MLPIISTLRRRMRSELALFSMKWDEAGNSSRAYAIVGKRKLTKAVSYGIPKGTEVTIKLFGTHGSTFLYVYFNNREETRTTQDVSYSFIATTDVEVDFQYEKGTYSSYKVYITMPAERS